MGLGAVPWGGSEHATNCLLLARWFFFLDIAVHSHYNVEVAIANLLQNPHIMDQGGSPSPAGVNARRRTPQASPGSAAGSPQTSLARFLRLPVLLCCTRGGAATHDGRAAP